MPAISDADSGAFVDAGSKVILSRLHMIRSALANILAANIVNLNAYEKVEDVVETPAVIVEPRKADFTGASNRGLDTWHFNLYVLIERRDSGYAQNELDDLLSGGGPNSIREVIFKNADLGIGMVDAFVSGMHGYGGSFENQGLRHVGAILQVTVITDGTS